MVCPQVHKMETELRHKLFPSNAWMAVLHVNVLASCPKDEIHQWFIRLYGEHIIPAIVHSYTKVLQRPDLATVDKDSNLITVDKDGIRKLYEPSPVPTVYVGRIEHLLGLVSLFPCFLDGNSTSTIPHKYAPRQKQAFAFGCAYR
jgi:hypothetical protein